MDIPWQETQTYEQAELAALTREELEQLREYSLDKMAAEGFGANGNREAAYEWTVRNRLVVGVLRQKAVANV